MSGRTEWLCYTDGSCKPGDGAPGGWGFCVRPPVGAPIEGYGNAIGTISKVMEYRAVAHALAALPEDVSAIVFSDDQSLVESLGKALSSWRASAFANVDPRIVDDVRSIAESIATKRLDVRFQWLRSHNGNVGNERADALAAQGAREAREAVRATLDPRRARRR